MRSQVGPVGTVLSVAFALFIVTVLFLLKLWYLRRSRRAPDALKKKQAPLGRTGALKARSVWRFTGNTEGKARESWGKTLAMWFKGASLFEVQEDDGDKQKEQRIEGGGDVEEAEKEKEKEEEEEEEEDVLSLGGLLGAARLLFTIREETMEEMQVEEARCSNFEDAHGKRKAGNGSTSSGSASPFVTPPSSPPFATPFGSPALKIPDPSEHRPSLPLRADESADLGSASASASCSSSSSSPVLLGGRPPSLVFFDDTTDTGTASSSPSLATPAALSPTSPPAHSSADNRRIFLQDPPHSPSSLLSYNCHTNRVYPLDNRHLHGSCILENKLKPLSPLSLEKLNEPSGSFHLPPLSQPSTPSPFRSSLFTKARTQGAASSPALLLHPRFFPVR